jgi:hypothetical protein
MSKKLLTELETVRIYLEGLRKTLKTSDRLADVPEICSVIQEE